MFSCLLLILLAVVVGRISSSILLSLCSEEVLTPVLLVSHEVEEGLDCVLVTLSIMNLLCECYSLSTENQSVDRGSCWESGSSMITTAKTMPL